MKISKTVLGIIAAVAALTIIAVLVLQVPGAPVTAPPAPPGGAPINTSGAEQKLGTGSVILTATGKLSGGALTEVVVDVYYLGARTSEIPSERLCTEGGVALRSCQMSLSQAQKCESVEFTCSSSKANNLQDRVVLSVSTNPERTFYVSLGKLSNIPAEVAVLR